MILSERSATFRNHALRQIPIASHGVTLVFCGKRGRHGSVGGSRGGWCSDAIKALIASRAQIIGVWMSGMTKLLEQAVDQARELPEEDQDAAAEALLANIATRDQPHGLPLEQAEEVKRIRARLQSGETRLATDEEVSALWKKCGV